MPRLPKSPACTSARPAGHADLAHRARRRRPPGRAHGAAVQWGTARTPGTFLADAPLKVPAEVIGFAAERLDADRVVLHVGGHTARWPRERHDRVTLRPNSSRSECWPDEE
ncbi:DUF4158 domain-containing protein [Streptosporangium canum]|uniref:DUF4158 domain-containing protein n=1 Tax=Streptosporangium canum TaxID=324952 RepID=UPI003436B944